VIFKILSRAYNQSIKLFSKTAFLKALDAADNETFFI
jgi:hypothetical protein